jgi:hypothetical protein
MIKTRKKYRNSKTRRGGNDPNPRGDKIIKKNNNNNNNNKNNNNNNNNNDNNDTNEPL